jgi:hypothetical protein
LESHYITISLSAYPNFLNRKRAVLEKLGFEALVFVKIWSLICVYMIVYSDQESTRFHHHIAHYIESTDVVAKQIHSASVSKLYGEDLIFRSVQSVVLGEGVKTRHTLFRIEKNDDLFLKCA